MGEQKLTSAHASNLNAFTRIVCEHIQQTSFKTSFFLSQVDLSVISPKKNGNLEESVRAGIPPKVNASGIPKSIVFFSPKI